MKPNVSRAGLVLAAFLAGVLTGPVIGGSPLAPVTLQPGDSITIYAATPSPSPTPTPTGGLTLSPSPTLPVATTTPTPAAITCPSSLQAAINAATSGSTVNVTGCPTFRERVTIAKPLTLVGAVINGTGISVPQQQGILEVTGSDVVIDHVRATGSYWAGVRVTGQRVVLRDSEFDNNRQEGYNVSLPASDVTFLRDHIHHNNVALTVSPTWEAGGGKGHVQKNLTFDGNEVDHNGGPGIWLDQTSPPYNPGTIIRNNRVHHNVYAGIMFEVSDGADIYGNAVWENGWGDKRGWGWPAGILLSSSRNARVHDNVVAWNAVGIALISQNRGDNPGTPIGLSATNNVIAGRSPVGKYVDWSPPAIDMTISPNTIVTAGDPRLVGVPAQPEAGHG